MSKRYLATSTVTSSDGRPRLAIIGGGLAGMISCRVALTSGRYSRIVVYDKNVFYGGTWTPSRKSEGPVYEDLKVNLPSIIMGEPCFPWRKCSESFPHHSEYRSYIQSYWNDVLGKEGQSCFRMGQDVLNVKPREDHSYEVVTSESEQSSEIFEQVLVCTGHFDAPYVPQPFDIVLHGRESMREETVFHSKNWSNIKTKLQGRDVVLVGFGPSAIDFGDFLGKEARSLHWVHSSFADMSDPSRSRTINADSINFWTRIELSPAHESCRPVVRLTRADGETCDFAVSKNDADDDGCSIVFATGYAYDYSFLDERLRPIGGKALGGKKAVPTDNLACNYILAPGRFAFVGMQNVMVPAAVMYYQALAFVHWDRDYFLETAGVGDHERIWAAVQSDHQRSGTFYDPSQLHYSQQAYCHQLLRTLCRTDEERSLANSGLRAEAELMLKAWSSHDNAVESKDTIVGDAFAMPEAARVACELKDSEKLSPGASMMPPYRASFESDLLLNHEVYRTVSEMRAERRLTAFRKMNLASPDEILRALVEKTYAQMVFERFDIRHWNTRPTSRDLNEEEDTSSSSASLP